jgi:hypothetical protein
MNVIGWESIENGKLHLFRYDEGLTRARKKGIIAGIALGFTIFVQHVGFNVMQGLAFWYSTVLVIKGTIQPNALFTVILFCTFQH